MFGKFCIIDFKINIVRPVFVRGLAGFFWQVSTYRGGEKGVPAAAQLARWRLQHCQFISTALQQV
jgi:hypothetical protein